jgi:hypothetical protein
MSIVSNFGTLLYMFFIWNEHILTSSLIFRICKSEIRWSYDRCIRMEGAGDCVVYVLMFR